MVESSEQGSVEQQDLVKLNQAIEFLTKDELGEAEELLLAISQNAPKNYVYSFRQDGKLHIKLWDQAEFLHRVNWIQENGGAEDCVWVPSVYPRAFYYLGFLNVHRGMFEEAVRFLQQGLCLESSNPKLRCELGQAYSRQGKYTEALEAYASVGDVGPHVSVCDKALALRGTGFVLIEMGELAEADTAFRESLRYEPENVNAKQELQYIEHLRSGGHMVGGQLVTSGGEDLSRCSLCGNKFNKGVVVSVEGRPLLLCRRCHGKLTKQWWQFWK